jgi:hypothetical protein
MFSSLMMVLQSTETYCVLTLCRRATDKYVISKPCVVGGSRISTFSRATAYSCVCGLFCLTYRVKVIGGWKQGM